MDFSLPRLPLASTWTQVSTDIPSICKNIHSLINDDIKNLTKLLADLDVDSDDTGKGSSSGLTKVHAICENVQVPPAAPVSEISTPPATLPPHPPFVADNCNSLLPFPIVLKKKDRPSQVRSTINGTDSSCLTSSLKSGPYLFLHSDSPSIPTIIVSPCSPAPAESPPRLPLQDQDFGNLLTVPNYPVYNAAFPPMSATPAPSSTLDGWQWSEGHWKAILPTLSKQSEKGLFSKPIARRNRRRISSVIYVPNKTSHHLLWKYPRVSHRLVTSSRII